jgi:hypothetical protein
MVAQHEPSPEAKDSKPDWIWWPSSDGSNGHRVPGATLVLAPDPPSDRESRAEEIWGSPETPPTSVAEARPGPTSEEIWGPGGGSSPPSPTFEPGPAPRLVLPDAWAAAPPRSGWRKRVAFGRISRRTG